LSPPPGLLAFKLSFELSPIILTGGAASFIPGGMLPIIALTEAADFVTGLLSGNVNDDLDSYFAHFYPMPGGKLANNSIGEYPFANQQVAANAIIANPLNISMRMVCPAKGDGGYALKLATMVALQAVIANHTNSGGTFTVATPSYYYTDLILTGLTDVTSSGAKQPQSEWQWDFTQPLLTQAAADAAMNSMMNKLSQGLPSTGATSGLDTTVGAPNTLATSQVAPVASNTAGTSVASQLAGGVIPV
jgi:hypothetical protein